MFNCYKLLLLSLSVFMTGLLSLNPSLAAPVPDSSLKDNASSYQTAFLYFLPDYKDGEVESNDHNREYCRKQGYTQNHVNCPSPRILKQRCPVGNYYKECYCAGSPSCTGSKSSSNPYPTSTGASSSSCVDCPGNTLWTWTCSSSTCASYQLSSCPSRGYCSRCCDGYYKLDSCQSGYHIEGSGSSATCAVDETCFGSTSRDTGLGYTCSFCTDLQGQTLYDCSCTGSCSLSSCPANGNCSTDCKGKICLDSCKSGYSKSGNSCVSNHVHSYECPSGYSETNSWGSEARTTGKVCSCGGTSGTCYMAPLCTPLSSETSCSTGYTLASGCDDGCGGTRSCCVACDPEDRDCQCPGKVYCDPDTKVGDGATCTAGSKTFYERCLVKETCDNSYYRDGNKYCAVTSSSSWSGYYYVKDKCTTQKGTTYKYYGSCNGGIFGDDYDCNGGTPPCMGKKECTEGYGVGTPCECSGKKYYDSCSDDTCPGPDGLTENGGRCTWYNERSAPTGYYKVKDNCTKGDGTKYSWYKRCTDSSVDCLGNMPPCPGKKECPDDKGTGECSCGEKKFFDECGEACSTDGQYIDLGYGKNWYYADLETSSKFSSGGYYAVSQKCVRSDNVKVYYYASCTDKESPCSSDKGYRTCGYGYFGAGEECTCGGKKYFEACVTTCDYEKTEADCASGQTFTKKCYGTDSSGNQTWYGECK